MTALLRLVTLPYLRQNPLRVALTILGVACGVAVFVAIRVTNLSTLHAFTETVDAVSGRTQLQVVGEVAGLDQSLYARVRSMPGLAAAVPVVTGYAVAEEYEGELLFVLGVDVLLDRQVRDYRIIASQDNDREALRALFDPATVFLSDTFARRHGLGLGDPLSLLTPRGRHAYTIRGLLAPDGPAKALGGNFIVMDLAAAQLAFQKAGKLDRIDLILRPGVTAVAMQEALQARLGDGVKVERPSFRTATVEKMLQSFQVNLTALSMIALFVGMFLIYNTLSSAVVERRRDIAILRAVGAKRAAVGALFLMEGLIIGIIGTGLGIPLGLGLSRLTLYIVSQTLVSIFLVVAIERLMISPGIVLSAVTIGIMASIVSVIIPTREATGVQPVDGLALAQYQVKPRRNWRSLLVPGVIWFIVGSVLSRLQPVGDVPLFGYLSAFSFLCGFSLLMPAAIVGFSWFLRPWLFRLFRAEGEVAADNLQSALSRNSVAAASLMTGVAMVVSVAIMISSFKRTVNTWVDQTVKADLIISAADPTSGITAVPLAESLARALTEIAGVSEVDALRVLSLQFQGRQITLNVGDLDVFGRHTEYPFLEGEAGEVFAEVTSHDSVIVSENFRNRFGLGRGDTLILPTPKGPHRFRIAGVSIDYSSDQGTVVMHWAIFRQYWTEGVVDSVGVFLQPGASPEAVATEIRRRFGSAHRLFIFSNQTFKAEIYQLIDQSFVITYALEVIAVAIGILGIANALYTAVLERQREISVLRALGAFRHQVRKIIMLESGLLGILGVAVGTLCGSCLSLILIYVINRQSFGWTLRFDFPGWTIAANLTVIFLAALAAGVWPASQASNVCLIEKLRME
ncbi:MAG TPA: FtsX-like permease family protein [Alphaproteobacteria bacterium]|nr:FtsX-like permease family protein [Alphaproteobacteria bacterium]